LFLGRHLLSSLSGVSGKRCTDRASDGQRKSLPSNCLKCARRGLNVSSNLASHAPAVLPQAGSEAVSRMLETQIPWTSRVPAAVDGVHGQELWTNEGIPTGFVCFIKQATEVQRALSVTIDTYTVRFFGN